VDEKSDNSIRQKLPQKFGHEQKVIIVNPNKIPRLVHVQYPASKGVISGLVRCPMFVSRSIFSSNVLPKQIMEKRPKC
jgi:hypothetical protein